MKILVAMIAVTALATGAFADTWTDPATGIEWTYTVTNGRAFLGGGTYQTPAVAKSTVDITIPDTIGIYPVGGISAYGFYNLDKLTNIVISTSVASIGDNAFSWCRKLTTIAIPGSVETIGRNAFVGCYGLRTMVLNEGLREIGPNAFQHDYSLDEVTIPNSVTNISQYAFDQTSIRRATIGTGVQKIGTGAFGGCSNLAEVEFLGDRNAIDMKLPHVFKNTPYLESLEFSLFIEDGNYLSGFTGVCPETVNIPDGVSYIANTFDGGFPSVTNLVNLSLPASITYLDRGIFSGCIKLQSVTFGREDWYDHYDMMAFKGTPFFDSLPFSLGFESRGIDGETFMAYVVGCIGRCPAELDIEAVYAAKWEADRQRILKESGGYEDIGEAPEIGVIAERAFASCDIRRVVLPGGLSVIESGAFADCTNLTHVAFSGNAPSEIAEDAFYVYMPGHYNEWDEWVDPYYGPNTNCTVYVPSTSAGWGVDIPGTWMGMPIRYSASGIVEDGVLVSVSLGGDTEYTVPSGVTNIAANAFAGCADLERVVIPDGVESIDRTAFDGCGKLWANWYKALANGAADMPCVSAPSELMLTVTNVVVHYVAQSVQSAAVIPPATAGIVNIISEVNAGNVMAIPQEWASQYPGFEAKFGGDFAKAVTMQTGKFDGAGKPMLVWQDFVAGTDPTNPDDVFAASITFDAVTNEPIISWTPELTAEEAAKRTYKTFGKVRLTDAEWAPVDGNASEYNFFKVTVEMK